jgi:hypothetical protein
MHRFCCLAVSSLLLGGCASTSEKPPSSDGKPDYVALEWCDSALVQQYREDPTASGSAECGPDDALCDKASATIAACNPLLRRETVQGPDFVNGRFVFGLSTDAEGRVSDLCLIDTNLGNTPDTLSCVARAARAEGMKFEPNLKAQPWSVTWALQQVR